jgi:muramidase (phage lysozyme)
MENFNRNDINAQELGSVGKDSVAMSGSMSTRTEEFSREFSGHMHADKAISKDEDLLVKDPSSAPDRLQTNIGDDSVNTKSEAYLDAENIPGKTSDFDPHPVNEVGENAVEVSVDGSVTADGKSKYGSLQLTVLDGLGHFIPDLGLKVIIKEKTIFLGKTDKNGGVYMEKLPLGEALEILVKTDDGPYKQIAIATIEARENVASLRSPKTKIELTSIYHQGQPGHATQEKEKVIQRHNQKPADRPEITGNLPIKPEPKIERDEHGHPVARLAYGLTDWFGLNRMHAALWTTVRNSEKNRCSGRPSTGDQSNHAAENEHCLHSSIASSGLEHLNRLVDFVEKQAGWKYPDGDTSDVIVAKMRTKRLDMPQAKPLYQPLHLCNKYVKIALAYAEYGENGEVVGNGVSPARLMGKELNKAGFVDISETLGRVEIAIGSNKIEEVDLIYSLPGDVIVYSDRRDASAAGHIDIRTYHGFVSDFVWPGRNGLPDLKKYKVLGVYRQYSDEFSMARINAFLRILREHEAKGYKDPYRALKYDSSRGLNSHTTFDDLSSHPSDGRSNLPAGAYQIKFRTFKGVIDETGWSSTFEPKSQDRIAMYLLQGRRLKDSLPSRTALGYIMQGNVELAIKNTKLWLEWSCLPSDEKETQMTMSQLKEKFAAYTGECVKCAI